MGSRPTNWLPAIRHASGKYVSFFGNSSDPFQPLHGWILIVVPNRTYVRHTVTVVRVTSVIQTGDI